MINTIITSLKIERTYAINSFFYNLKRLPFFKDLLTDDIYKSKNLKTFFNIIGTIYYIFKIIFFRLLYFCAIYFLASFLNHSHMTKAFIHIYVIFTLLGLFINNKLLNTSLQKYFSIILFKINAKKYMKSSLFFDLFRSLFLNSIAFFLIKKDLNISLNICLILIIIPFLSRIVGESLNILYYKKHQYLWLNNYYLYFPILIIFLFLATLPFFNIYLTNYLIIIITTILLLIVPFSLRYLLKIDDYKLIYKKLNTKNAVMNKDESMSYSRQQMVAVKEKDVYINPKKLQNKRGYDFFNTIFFERHKEILLRSVKKYSLIIFFLYIILFFLVKNNTFIKNIHDFLLFNSSWFILIMYFINRGAIITQAMFFNCDHAMLSYNFYREPQVLLNLFKKRTLTVVKVNLIPAIIMGTGNIILLYLIKEINLLLYLAMFLFIIFLSIFFSVHYLVIYYLFQPYNKEMQIKKTSYSIITLFTYVICYFLATSVKLNIYMYSLLGILFSLLYVLISLILVWKYSPKTFKLN